MQHIQNRDVHTIGRHSLVEPTRANESDLKEGKIASHLVVFIKDRVDRMKVQKSASSTCGEVDVY